MQLISSDAWLDFLNNSPIINSKKFKYMYHYDYLRSQAPAYLIWGSQIYVTDGHPWFGLHSNLQIVFLKIKD